MFCNVILDHRRPIAITTHTHIIVIIVVRALCTIYLCTGHTLYKQTHFKSYLQTIITYYDGKRI